MRGFPRLLLICFAAQFSLLLWMAWSRPGSGTLRYAVLDVGQGDGTVLETPSGHVMVVDTGGVTANGVDRGGPVVSAYLKSRGINRINVLALTHPHADHIGGAVTLLRRFPVGLLLDDGANAGSPEALRIEREAAARHIPYRAARRGEIIDFGDGARAEVVAPAVTDPSAPVNDASLVLRVTYGRAALLLTGDAEALEENEALKSGEPLAAQLLKVGHHGSHTSSTPGLLAAVRPQIAVISVGAHNLYGHPSPEIPPRLQAAGAKVYRTDRDGAVICVSDGQAGFRAETMIASGQRP